MPRKEYVFFSVIILMGLLDWLTTVAGMVFFGATEANPILSGATKSNMMLFSAVKLTAVVLAGLSFYKAATLSRQTTKDWRFAKGFLNGSCSLTVLGLSAVNANNMAVILS